MVVVSKPAGRIDYSGLAFPKGPAKAVERQRAAGREERQRAKVKAAIMARDRNICRAYGVSPVCQKLAWDRHELKPVGIGGKVTTGNSVAICRADHRACQNGVGGRSLEFTWPGKADGEPPDADAPGFVQAVWKGIWRGVGRTSKGA